MQDALEANQQVLIECAQGVMLDIDYGTYPFVTSSSPSAAGACQGAGVAPSQVERVIGVFKAYSTRVGAGPMPTELHDETGALIRDRGREYGTTTGRPRRTGWFDAVAGRNAVRLNGVSEIAMTLVDVFDVFPEVRICTDYRLGSASLDYMPADLEILAQVVPAYDSLSGWMEDITAARSVAELPMAARSYATAIGEHVGAKVTDVGGRPRTRPARAAVNWASGNVNSSRTIAFAGHQLSDNSGGARMSAKSGSSELNAEQIQAIIPHRYPFLLVDRIIEIESGKRAVGIKNVTINEPFFQGHFPQYAVMPGVLIVEALAQVGGVALGQMEEYRGRLAFFAGIDKVRFKRQVRPGDTLRLEVELSQVRRNIGTGAGTATVDGELACRGEFMFAMGPLMSDLG